LQAFFIRLTPLKMKNKFTQKIIGECGIVVIANILNNKKVISEFKNPENGTSSLQQRKAIENYSNYSFRGIYEVRKYSNRYSPVFEVDEDFSNNQKECGRDHYILFLAGLKDGENKGHAILVIKENHNKTLIILDPLKEKSEIINQDNFFKSYPCVSIDMVVEKEDGAMIMFYESSINHLM
jgi:hypothetical protein